jgi:hypothetical protein
MVSDGTINREITEEFERVMRSNTSHTSGLFGLARRALGFTCLGIWALGVILPVIPGWPALIVAIVLLGRRDRTLRHMHLVGRRALRWMRTHPAPRVKSTGLWLNGQYVSARRTLTPAILRAERTFQF